MAFSKKPDVLVDSGKLRREDFLSASNINGLQPDEPEIDFWERLSDCADEDSARWEDVRDAMCRFECQMEIKGTREATWMHIAPDPNYVAA